MAPISDALYKDTLKVNEHEWHHLHASEISAIRCETMLIHINTGSQTPSRENEETRIYENQNVCVSVHTYKILIIKTTLGSPPTNPFHDFRVKNGMVW